MSGKLTKRASGHALTHSQTERHTHTHRDKMQVKWLGAYDLCLLDVSASLLSPSRAGGNPSTSKYPTWLSVGKASGNTAVAPPSTLMVGSKCKYQNVLSFFFLSLFLFAHYLMKFCVWAAAPPFLSSPSPHSSSSPGWTTFSTRLATSWIAVDTFCLLSSIFQIDWLRLRLLLLLSEQENNSKILCKYFVCIFHLIFNLLSFFMVFLLSSLPRICMTFCFCVYFRLMKNLWLCGRVFFFFFFVEGVWAWHCQRQRF